jgi:hypothetical protein
MFGSRKREALEQKLVDLETSIGRLSEQIDTLSKTTAANAKPRGGALLKYLGVSPGRFLERYFEGAPPTDYYAALNGGSESLRGRPEKIGLNSGVCRQIHFSTDEFRYWINAMGRPPIMHRKDWELFYVAQVLFERDMLEEGKKGLVFAVGQEPLPALFAARGCEILATDQAPETAVAGGWIVTGQHSAQVDTLYREQLCPRDLFYSKVRYQSVDMNHIPDELSNRFDFCWSTCSYEHLGSLEHGLKFVERSIDTLVPGGIAVHTTEFNLSSNDDTLESEHLSIFRQRDMDELAARLTASGHEVAPFDWSTGPGFAETVVDLPPYKASPHLKLKLAQYDCTSVGIIVRKKAD